MTQTKTRNRKNGNSKTTPDLMSTLGAKRGRGRPKKPAPTADQIADQIEAKAKELQDIANILRGRV